MPTTDDNLAGEPTPEALSKFLEVLELERIDDDHFTAINPPRESGPRSGLFGGQVAAQALRAAAHTVQDEHFVHSLHGYFLRPGKNDTPTMLRVDRIRDGRSFTTRTVVAEQNGEAIFTLTASFHKDEPGGEYTTPIATDVPSPEQLLAERGVPPLRWDHDRPFERVEIPDFSHAGYSETPRRAMWVRTRGRLPDDPHLHACVLTFISDMGIVGAVRAALGRLHERGMGASLDHAMWFHRRVRADEWLLFDVSSKSNAGSRGLGVGSLHTAAGVHAVTIGQEALVRIKD